MPSSIEFKQLGQHIDFDFDIVHYPTYSSDSGAYIFAPFTEAVPLQLKITDAYIVTNHLQSIVYVTYKS